MRAERNITQSGVADAVYSSWVSVPVTTYMVEAPDTFALVSDSSYNKYTQLKVSWRARDYLDSEIWIRADSDSDYSSWTSVSVTNDKPPSLQGTSYKIFYATISGLRSSTGYYIKVRARISRMVNGSTTYDYSKFVGPLNSRTEFSQSYYDDNVSNKQDEITFNDKMKGLSDLLYWTLTNSESTTKVKLRRAKAINAISHGNTDKLVIDLTKLKYDSTVKIIYIPFDVFDYINKNNKLLSIKDNFGEMLYRAKTLDSTQKDIYAINKEIEQNSNGIKKIFVKITIKKIDSGSASLPASMKNNLSSKVIQLNVDALGMSDTDENIETNAASKLTSLLQSKLNDFINKSKSNKDTAEKINALMKGYVEDCIANLGDYVQGITENLIVETKTLLELSNSVQFKLLYNALSTQGQQMAYQYINSSWNKLATQVNNLDKTAVFEVRKPSMVAAFKNGSQSGSSNSGQLTKQFGELEAKYGISEVILTNGTYDGQANINFKQMIEVVCKILGQDIKDNAQDTITLVSKNLGLNDRASKLSQDRKLTREEAAYIAIKLYAAKTGVGLDKLKTSKAINIADAKQIDPTYYKAVIMAVDLKLISLDSSNKVLPQNQVSKDDGLLIIKMALSLTGNI
jgi:ferredoxin-fold anticodon binding domain-containing protein